MNVKTGREKFKKIIKDFSETYGLENVWNLDETALFYMLLQNNTIADKT